MGLAQRARALWGSWRENTAATWTPLHISTPQGVDCHSSGYFSLLCTPGSSVWQGIRQEHNEASERAQRLIIQQLPEIMILFFSALIIQIY